ncbi:MAG TPA: single-stranded-DNA-specific exonuclease RecJ [Longimicrobiaceae bacterium]
MQIHVARRVSRPLDRRWVIAPAPPLEAVESLSRNLSLPPVLCRVLAARGIHDVEAAREYLRPRLHHIHDPTLLAGMGDAVARLARAVRSGETILVHGDYDVDGICATAVYVRALRMMGGRAEAFVPHRLNDGYDLTHAGVGAAQAVGAGLILTGDCGIVAHQAIELAARSGIDVVVTDHHTPGPTLPDAIAVVNPNRPDCSYPDKGLAGAGVAYKVCCALAAELGFPVERLVCFLDLVAIATIADLAPLTMENRALVRWGLSILPDTPNPGLRALLVTTGLAGRGPISAGQVGYVLAPRINAVGRMGEALRGVQLLLTDDPHEARRIAATLEEENRWRREVDAETLREAMAMLERAYDPARDRGLVLASERWHPGVIGIVASRVVEEVHRPTVLIALNGEEGRGSARSIPGFHLYEAMRACAHHLTRFGGHRAAAGCSLTRDRVDAFRAAFDAEARARLSEEQLIPEVRIDLEVSLAEIDHGLYRLLKHAAPFGVGNPTPVFAARGIRLAGTPRVVGRRHLRMTLAMDGARLEAIGYGMAERLAEVNNAARRIDVAFKLDENHWNGRTELQAKLLDLRPAQ